MSDTSEDAAPPNAAEGSPPSPGDVPAGGTGSAATDDAAARERALARKTAASFRAGKAEGQQELLGAFGGRTAEEIQRILDAHAAAEEEQEHAAAESQVADERSAIRALKSEARAKDRALEETRATLQRLREQNDRARRTELHNRLQASGAHPDAISDLVSLLHDRVEWSDEGDGLEVVDRDGDKVVPSGMTLDELIAEQREQRAYMFAAPGPRSGSGTQVRATAAPGNGVPVRRETWRDRVVRARTGR